MEQLISIQTLNEFFNNKDKYLVSTKDGYHGVPDYDGRQGEYNETFKYYRHPDFPENVFIQERWVTDSYGDNDTLENILFVQSRQKTVTVYEPF